MLARTTTVPRLLFLSALAGMFFPAVVAQDRIAEYREKFNRETDAVHKAKALTKLGRAELDEVRQKANDRNYDAALAMLRQYRDDVRLVLDALKATGVDAERKPNGFKQLQISVRESLWKLDRILPGVPQEELKPFDEVRKELQSHQAELINLLFPRRPGKTPKH